MSDEGYELGEGLVLTVTEKAVLVQVEGEEIWVPKSILHEDSEIDEESEKDDEGDVLVKTWWAEQEGYA
jgi:hypothetical protein